MEQGLLHIYCGDGKGKTTAAIGLAVRAKGAGLRVCFVQFMKAGSSSELTVLKKADIQVFSVQNPFGFTWNMTTEQKKALETINTEAVQKLLIEKDNYDVLVLDEILSAYQHQLIDRALVCKLLQEREQTEMVLTGRNPEKELLEMADYVTEMKCVKHPYEKGVQARLGIEF